MFSNFVKDKTEAQADPNGFMRYFDQLPAKSPAKLTNMWNNTVI